MTLKSFLKVSLLRRSMQKKLKLQLGAYVLRPMDISDTEWIRKIRNVEIVHRFLTQQEEISAAKQRQWYRDTYQEDSKQQRFVLEREGDGRLGTLSLVDISLNKGGFSFAEAGIVLDPEYWDRTTGQQGVNLLAYYSFDVLHLDAIFTRVPQQNRIARLFDRRCGLRDILATEFASHGLTLCRGPGTYFKGTKEDARELNLNGVAVDLSFDPQNLTAFPK